MGKRIPSEEQTRTARQNGQKSRGPASETGKANSSRNALRHGVLASAVVIEGESRGRFITLLRDLHAHFQPASAIETSLIENMAVCRWRQMRVWAMKKAGLNHEIVRRTLEVLGRYETRYARQYNRALLSLTELQRKRGIALVA